jgi:hypothetical protein
MKNNDIPSELWKLKNEAVRLIENNAHSNSAHTDFKRDWWYIGHNLKSIGEKIEQLANEFKQEE